VGARVLDKFYTTGAFCAINNESSCRLKT